MLPELSESVITAPSKLQLEKSAQIVIVSTYPEVARVVVHHAAVSFVREYVFVSPSCAKLEICVPDVDD